MNCNSHLFNGLSYETRMMLNRRQFFGRGGSIVGAAALGSLLGSQPATAGPAGLSVPHFPAKAKPSCCVALFAG